MSLAINIALILLSAVGTLAAFGGKTWVDDERPLLQRITRRGWVALICVTLATCAGAAKALRDQESSRAAAKSQGEDRAKLDGQGVELRQTRRALEAQSLANLVTTLSSGDRVLGQKIELLRPGNVGDPVSFGELLFPDLPAESRQIAEINLSIHGQNGVSFVTVPYGQSHLDAPADRDGITRFVQGNAAGLVVIQQVEDDRNRGVNAATAYASWADEALVLQIGLRLGHRAASESEVRAIARRYGRTDGRLATEGEDFLWVYEPPPGLLDRLRARRRTQPARGLGTLLLGAPGGEPSPVNIQAEVLCSDPARFHETIQFACRTRGSPRIGVERY